MINVGIIGATGYTGEVLLDILMRHPDVRLAYLASRVKEACPLSELFPRFRLRCDLEMQPINVRGMSSVCDVVFLALPHTVSQEYAPQFLNAGIKVIDLSADYRFKSARIYEQYYGVQHKDPENLKLSVYGLPELYRQKIKKARLVANPGCYPTAAILGLAPLMAVLNHPRFPVVIDAKSGASGAGKKLAQDMLFSEINEDFRAYKVNEHQHMPEINQELSHLAGCAIHSTFVPHLLPLSRGILETIYVFKPEGKNRQINDVWRLYKKFYQREPSVRVLEKGSFPRLRDVAGTNYCDIGIREESDKVIIIVAIDNLVKGASGQAVQNMNIMFGIPEIRAL